MASRDVPTDVIDMLADERGRPAHKLQLSDRLLQDLGMDGDDAVEFFNRLHERFGTDLTHLHEHWSEHFGPEGFPLWNGLIILAAAIVGGVVAAFAGLSTWWGLIFAVALLVGLLWIDRRWGPPDKMVPLTVADALRAVEAGAWPSRPPH